MNNLNRCHLRVSQTLVGRLAAITVMLFFNNCIWAGNWLIDFQNIYKNYSEPLYGAQIYNGNHYNIALYLNHSDTPNGKIIKKSLINTLCTETPTKSFDKLLISTDDIKGNITRIAVRAASNKNSSLNLSITVGGKAFGIMQNVVYDYDKELHTFSDNGQGQVVISFTPNKKTLYNTFIYLYSIEITYDNNVTELYDTAELPQPSTENIPVITLHRKVLGNSWNGICLPFSMTTEEIKATFGQDAKVAIPLSMTESGLQFDMLSTPTIEAGQPVLLYATNDTEQFTVYNKAVTSEVIRNNADDISTYRLVGTLAKTVPNTGVYYFDTIIPNTLHRLTPSGTIKAYRAYFQQNNNNMAESKPLPPVMIDNVTLISTQITIQKADNHYHQQNIRYNLYGQQVDADYKGIVIVNGRKIISQ